MIKREFESPVHASTCPVREHTPLIMAMTLRTSAAFDFTLHNLIERFVVEAIPYGNSKASLVYHKT